MPKKTRAGNSTTVGLVQMSCEQKPETNLKKAIAGINEALRRQGLLAGRWCLDPNEDLSPGQMEEIDRVIAAYPHLVE